MSSSFTSARVGGWGASSTSLSQQLLLLVLCVCFGTLLSTCEAQQLNASTPGTTLVASTAPCYIREDSAGFLYAASCEDDVVLKLTKTGQVVETFSTASLFDGTLIGLEVTGTTVYAIGNANDGFYTYYDYYFPLVGFNASSGAVVLSSSFGYFFVVSPYGYVQVQGAIATAMRPDGQAIYCLANDIQPIWEIAINGTLLKHINTTFQLGDFVTGLTVDFAGHIWLGYENQLVQVDANGATLQMWVI